MNDDPLTLSRASRPDGIVLLGSLAFKQLEANRVACFMVNGQGVIELVPAAELSMDYLDESTALSILTERHGYTNQQLVSYLKARDSRKKISSG